MKIPIAYFISPHGFGHASRAAAGMTALSEINPAFHFEIFTRVPRWFFADSLHGNFTFHSTLTDIGLAQDNALAENIPQTIRQLKAFLPFDPAWVERLAQQVKRLKCKLLICDIAPLGIAVAQAAGIPSILIENFTWDWIYAGYADNRFDPFIQYLHDVFAQTDYHIQTEPVCAHARADLTTLPVSRKPRTPAKQIREQLGIPRHARAILITMGGIPQEHTFLDRLMEMTQFFFVIPGAGRSVRKEQNLILLPHRSQFFHPDLVNACDAIIGKAGYSTLAEAYHAGIPFGYVQRAKFREAPTMARFIHAEMHGCEIPAKDFSTGAWLSMLPALLAQPRIKRKSINGADQIARDLVSTKRLN